MTDEEMQEHIDRMVAMIREAEAAALTEHLAGVCGLSAWACSHCERTKAPATVR